MSDQALQLFGGGLPAPIAGAGDRAVRAFVEFFVARIRNKNTRAAYGRAVRQFLGFLEERGRTLVDVDAMAIAAYVEALGRERSPATIKQHLAEIRHLLDRLVIRGVLAWNPATSVRGPKHSARVGKTPVLTPEEARRLFEGVEEVGGVVGARDLALVSVMLFSIARVSAVVGLDIGDYRQFGSRSTFRFLEKGGKYHEVPALHRAAAAVEAYLALAEISGERDLPLFRRARARGGPLTEERLMWGAALEVLKRAAGRVGLPPDTGCHSMRATAITRFLGNGGALEDARELADHSRLEITALYDRPGSRVTPGEVERIRI